MSEPALGVLRQLEAEMQSAEHLGISMESVLYTGKDVPGRVTIRSGANSDNRIAFRLAYYWWLYKKSRAVDLILLRYSFHDPFQLLFILLCRRKVYTVHHTLEVPELGLSDAKFAWIKIVIERILGPITLSVVDGIVAVLEEMLDYEMDRRLIKRNIPHTVYSNGIDYYSRTDLAAFDSEKKQSSDTVVPQLLFISSVFAPWQGLEELITESAKYSGPFVCHVVGELNEQQAQMITTDDRFHAHGLQEKKYINELIARCDIGLSALTVYKKNLKNVPALKVREYLMEGLAVYAGHGDVLPESFKYYKNGPVDLAEMVEFAIENRNNERAVVSESARPYIEKEILLKNLYSFLLEHEAA